MKGRNALYFVKTVGPYEEGLWYDNVPQDDFDLALEKGWAKQVDESIDASPPCGCLLVEGRAIVVRTGGAGEYCPRHLPDALVKPVPKQRKSLKDIIDKGEL